MTSLWPEGTTRYLYPPLLAVLISPLTVLPVATAGLVWRSVLLVCTALGFWGLHRVMMKVLGLASVQAMAVVLMCVATWPALSSIRLGQASALVFASVAIALWALAEDRPAAAGAVLGLGVLIKVTPGLAFLLFWRPRMKSVLLGGLAAIILGTAFTSLFISPLAFARFFRTMMAEGHQSTWSINNQSLFGVVAHAGMSSAQRARLYVDPEAMSPALRMVALLATAVLVALGLWLLARPRRRAPQEAPSSRRLLFDLAALSGVAVIAAPLSLSHLYAAALPAYALWLATLFARRGQVPRIVWLGVAALQVLWLVPPVRLPDSLSDLGLGWLLLNPTFYAGFISVLLAWRARVPTEVRG